MMRKTKRRTLTLILALCVMFTLTVTAIAVGVSQLEDAIIDEDSQLRAGNSSITVPAGAFRSTKVGDYSSGTIVAVAGTSNSGNVSIGAQLMDQNGTLMAKTDKNVILPMLSGTVPSTGNACHFGVANDGAIGSTIGFYYYPEPDVVFKQLRQRINVV